MGRKDAIENWLAKERNITSFLGKPFSFGLGQIKLPAAREAEDYMAKIENHASRSDDELTKEILNPLRSIRLVAAILRKVQDDYKEHGFDISKDYGVLATLYNVGKSSERAKAAQDSGTTPKVNYFGFFISRYEAEIKQAAHLNVEQETIPSESRSKNFRV